MQQNILRSSEVSKIYLIYTDGKKNQRKEIVSLRYSDKKHCYFIGDIPFNFAKPGFFAKADIVVYTSDGVYQANVKMGNVSYTLNEIVYELAVPKVWNYTQMRDGTRKRLELPINVKFCDETVLEGFVYNISASGFSVASKTPLTLVQKKFPAICEIMLPLEEFSNIPEGKLTANCKFARENALIDDYEFMEHNLIGFKFLNLDKTYVNAIKNAIMKIK